MEACSKETKVAVAILDQPVEWNDKHEEVQIIFMISIKQGEQKQFEHLYDLFIEIVGNTKLQQNKLWKNFKRIVKASMQENQEQRHPSDVFCVL